MREQGEMAGEGGRGEEWGGATEGEEECQQEWGTMGGMNKDYGYVWDAMATPVVCVGT